MKLKQMIVLVLFAAFCGASAFASELHAPRDAAGTWTGLLSGNFAGTPYFSTFTLTIDQDGQHATGKQDSTVGLFHEKCSLVSFDGNGVALSHCTNDETPAGGAPTAVHWALTNNGEKIIVWIFIPSSVIPNGVAVSGELRRP